jgi:hypothetical protein
MKVGFMKEAYPEADARVSCRKITSALWQTERMFSWTRVLLDLRAGDDASSLKLQMLYDTAQIVGKGGRPPFPVWWCDLGSFGEEAGSTGPRGVRTTGTFGEWDLILGEGRLGEEGRGGWVDKGKKETAEEDRRLPLQLRLLLLQILLLLLILQELPKRRQPSERSDLRAAGKAGGPRTGGEALGCRVATWGWRGRGGGNRRGGAV